MQWQRFIDRQDMFNSNFSLDGIDRDLRHEELQDTKFIVEGETIKILPDFFLEHGRI